MSGWRVDADCTYGQDIMIKDDLDRVIAWLPHGDTDDGEGWALATAALLSAAPELLEACEQVLVEIDKEHVRRYFTYVDTIDKLKSAIAKAKGYSSPWVVTLPDRAQHRFTTRDNAVEFVKAEMQAWMNPSDRLGWWWKDGVEARKNKKPDLVMIVTENGEITDDCATLIEEVQS